MSLNPPEDAARGDEPVPARAQVDTAPEGFAGTGEDAGPEDGGGTVSDGHGVPEDGGTPAPPPTRRSARRWIVEWAVIVVVALLAAFIVRTYVAQTFYVPSTSMYPTLKAGDRIVVNKLFSSIQRGDIIVFKRPPAEDCGGPPVPDLVKRVIGLPGETISARGGTVYIDDKALKEPWLPKGPQSRTTNFGPDTIPKGDYFVMGDNRVNSCDSRMWGSVKGSYVVGKVVFIIWPLSQFRFF